MTNDTTLGGVPLMTEAEWDAASLDERSAYTLSANPQVLAGFPHFHLLADHELVRERVTAAGDEEWELVPAVVQWLKSKTNIRAGWQFINTVNPLALNQEPQTVNIVEVFGIAFENPTDLIHFKLRWV